MKFLTYDQLQGVLNEIEISKSSDSLSSEQIEEIKKNIELKPEEQFGKGQCLFNAYEVAKITGAEIIEGVAHIEVEKDNDVSTTVIKHAWNILNEKQFDITKDYVWPNMSVKLLNATYFNSTQNNILNYNIDDNELNFLSKVDLMACSLRYLKTKELIIAMLNFYGLNEVYHKRLLTDSIKTIKEN